MLFILCFVSSLRNNRHLASHRFFIHVRFCLTLFSSDQFSWILDYSLSLCYCVHSGEFGNNAADFE